MSARPQFQRPIAIGLLLAAVVVAAGCGSPATPFDPSGPCTADGRRAGAYPALESLVPPTLGGRPPDRLDSGRSCTDAALTTLRSHGVTELRFAGGLWEQGRNSGTTLAVFDSPSALEPAWLAELYEVGARSGRNTDRIETRQVALSGSTAFRLDTLNDDSFQTVIVGGHGGKVVAVLVASSVREVPTREAHERAVGEALAAVEAN